MAKFQSRLATHDWNHILSSKDTQGALTSFHDTICKFMMDAFPLVEAIQSISPESLGKVIHLENQLKKKKNCTYIDGIFLIL